MSLPEFEDLWAYASGNANEGDILPQHFYMTPEQAELTDWKLKVNDVILPVHSQLLCVACKVYCGMATAGGVLAQDGPIPLEGCSLAHALAFLRLVYRADCITAEEVICLLKSGYLPGVLRLAHSLDWSPLKRLSTLATKAIESTIPADEYDIAPVVAAASDLKLENIRSACFASVSQLCKAKSSDFDKTTCSSAVEVIDKLGDSLELHRAALLVMHSRKELSAIQLERLLDRTIELPSAVFTWRCSRESLEDARCFQLESDWFTWNDKEYRIEIQRNSNKPLAYGFFLRQKDPPEEAGQKVEWTFRLVHWLAPKASIQMKGRYSFSHDHPSVGCVSFFEKDALPDFVDADGFITFQIGHMKLVAG